MYGRAVTDRQYQYRDAYIPESVHWSRNVTSQRDIGNIMQEGVTVQDEKGGDIHKALRENYCLEI